MLRVIRMNALDILPMQAACGMAATEAATMVTLYVLLDPNALLLRARGLRYSFRASLEDVVAFSLARAAAVLLAYGFGAGRKYQRCGAIGCLRTGVCGQIVHARLRTLISNNLNSA